MSLIASMFSIKYRDFLSWQVETFAKEIENRKELDEKETMTEDQIKELKDKFK